MRSGGIEDIAIERGYDKKKKKNTGIKVIIFLLIIVLALFIGAYYYLTNTDEVSAKELFVTNISKTNFKSLLKKDIYANIIEKMAEKDFETETNINFTSSLKNEELKNVDLSKLTLDVVNKNDVDTFQSYNEAVLNYAENEVYKLKVISNENAIALFSNEILDKYIGCNYENLQKTFGINYNNDLRKLKNVENIDINEEEKNKYIEKYLSKLIENIPEEKFSIQENIVIQKAEESVDVTAYTVKLNKEEYNNIISVFLNTLKEDKELLGEFAGKKDEVQEEVLPEMPEVVPEENTEDEPIQNAENIEGEVPEDAETTEEPVVETVPEPPVVEQPEAEPTAPEAEDVQIEDINARPVITINPVGTVTPEPIAEDVDVIDVEDELSGLPVNNSVGNATDFIYRILLGKKTDMSVKELQKLIETKIKLEEYNQLATGQADKGLTINVYASEEKTEKITIEFPNEDSIDIEFVNSSEKENRIKITYLQSVDNQRNGFSLDFNKIQNDANTTIKATYCVIENEKINKKIIVDLKTDGTKTSNEIKNDVVLTVSTNKDETKVILDNTIRFKNVEGLENLVPENCLFLDQLPEEELKTTLDDLKNKFETLYKDKKESLNFINTNTGGITLEDISSTVKKEDAKNALITRVSNMMQEAIDNNQEFTIKNLENLTIEGYEVSSTVTEENAKIVVDIYTFNIDQNFTLTEVE